MDILRPNGSVERMADRRYGSASPLGYGRGKDRKPMDARSLEIARKNDRRKHSRQGDDPFRGRLIDLNT